MLVRKVFQILAPKFETFKSSLMLLSKIEDRTFDELAEHFCMFDINFIKAEAAIFLFRKLSEASRLGKHNKDKKLQTYQEEI